MANEYYVHLITANGRDARAGDERKNTGSRDGMHRQAHRLAHIRASQMYGSEVRAVNTDTPGYDVYLGGECQASYRVRVRHHG